MEIQGDWQSTGFSKDIFFFENIFQGLGNCLKK